MNTSLISTKEAYQKITETIEPLIEHKLRLEQSVSYILAKDVISPINMPPFRQSAMDGYAINIHSSKSYKLTGEVKAGDNYHPVLKAGEAVRIFTGAPVPDTANAVVMQEKVTRLDGQITIDNFTEKGTNIRPSGEQVKQGTIALKKGIKLTPASVGFLASLGIVEVFVYKRPSIAIVTTGNELVSIGTDLQYGQIYESNSVMLSSALQQLGFSNQSLYNVGDNYETTCTLLKNAISKHDVVLITGGISVGDYDFVGKALKALDVTEVFYKVKQKPGKPLFFGKKNETAIFALPGNPAAALNCFYIYVHTTLQILSGNTDYTLPKTQKKSLSAFSKKGDRAQFLKAIVKGDSVTVLDGQSSAMLQSFAIANGLVFLPADTMRIAIGDVVDVIMLPN
ncbi:gephyrin-like molybdotransferase Glp [uncultured Psychroserpens sp.]|uniref:molybdopterin molybdotransferase MoeA n=1 Tax=uncultured Psychroserpens sp. TaxID=255436 RepID=UPI002631020E|nr:gephyrin-like molybdotransferase Glp [uncultured Psychroserpens sp.]